MTIHMGTTKIEASKTAAEIQQLLGAGGARHVSMEYDGPEVVAVRFSVDTPHGEQWFCLPVRWEPVAELLGIRDAYRCQEQAKRTAWRLCLRWVQAQLAMIEVGQVEIAEVFLPYTVMDNKGTTLFERFVENGLKALPAGSQ